MDFIYGVFLVNYDEREERNGRIGKRINVTSEQSLNETIVMEKMKELEK